MRKLFVILYVGIIVGIIGITLFALEISHEYLGSTQTIYGKDIPEFNASLHEVIHLARNSSKLEVKSHTELTIYPSENCLKLHGKKILIVRNVGEGDIGRLALIYPKGVIFGGLTLDGITAKECRLEISTAIMPQAKAVILVLKIPKNKTGRITIKYHANITLFELFTSYVGMKESRNIFRTTYDGSEVLLSSLWLLKEIGNFEGFESQIRLNIPESWVSAIIDEEGKGFWKITQRESTDGRNNLVFISKNSRVPLIISGNFSVVRKNLSGVMVEVYQAGKSREDTANTTFKVLKVYSKLLGNYPYPSLKIFYLESLGNKMGYEFPQGIVLIHPERNETLLLAHEIAHSWFGDYASFGRMDETLANYAALTYTNESHELDEVEHSSLIDTSYSLAQVYEEEIYNPRTDGLVYYKAAFVFRSLQFVLGNETFSKGLRGLLDECHGKECNLTDVQDVFEEVSDQNLDWFFKEWFYTARVPDYKVGNLSIKQKEDRYLLNFEIIDRNNFKMPLEVELITQKEKIVKKVWIDGEAGVEFEVGDKPIKIILDLNEWILNGNREYNLNGIKVIVE